MLAVVVWTYACLKVFVTDVDRRLVGDLADYRLFFFIALAIALVIGFKRPAPIVAAFAYVLGYPAVVLLWKLPRLVYRRRSAVAFFAAVNVVTSVVADIKRTIVVGGLAVFAAFAIAVSHSRPVLLIAACTMAALLLEAIYRTVRFSVVPSRFLRMQQRAIRRASDSKLARDLTSPTEELLRPDIQKFNDTQQAAFLQNVGFGVIGYRGLRYWGYQLEQYRRSPAAIFFNGLAYLWLILRVILALALLNLALWHADTAAYSYTDGPTFLDMVRFVIAGLYGGEIEALKPNSNLADSLSIATFVVGLVVFGSLLLSSALSFRASRDQSEIRDTIGEINRQGAQLDQRLREGYEVSVEEAEERLAQLRYGLMGFINFLSTQIPDDFDTTGR